MKVLLLGSGGREHAIAHALKRSRRLERLFILPGNAGTAELGTNVPGDPCDVRLALEVARREKIDVTIVGPEDPLAAGIVDAFEQQNLRIFGPSAEAARLESDKAYAKQIMRQHAIPTADARVFDNNDLAREYIATRDYALVVKAAGLARGKGVIVCDDPSDAINAAERMLIDGAFGPAGKTIVVEERLKGQETSLLALVDGRTVYVLDPAQDYKRLGEGDSGPNTGGMGSYCPASTIDPAMMQQIDAQIFVPLMDALVRRETPYRGVLYAGLMLTPAGPKVLEFNCRFGDPETQVLLPRLKSDLLEVLDLACRGQLDQAELAWDPRAAVCVVMAAPGYPDKPVTGQQIEGLSEAARDGALIFHAGTKREGARVVSTGGRVLGVTGMGDTVSAARSRSYEAVERIRFPGSIWRTDIAAGI